MKRVFSPSPKRPLSPHLQIYRLPLSAILSILHRGTGLFLFVGAFVWCLYLVLWPTGKLEGLLEHSFFRYIGAFFLIGTVFSLFYHLLNGIRHLVWDFAMGLELKTVHFSGWIVIIFTGILTCFTIGWM